MSERVSTYNPLVLQAHHWTDASRRLGDLSTIASDAVWRSLEQYLHMELRSRLRASVQRLVSQGEALIHQVAMAPSEEGYAQVERLRRQYMRVETMMDFFANALASRTAPETIALLRACDRMAEYSMRSLLGPLGHPCPPALCYLDNGLGASILKANMRLWDGYTENPVAAIKVTRHNLLRPTSLIHEAGHQIAHITGWNAELRAALRDKLAPYGSGVADTWAGWASEIAADAFAFVHTGFASVAALHDVVDDPNSVFLYSPHDPHPISYLRVLMGIACCRQYFGAGPWDDMERDWKKRHALSGAPRELQPLLEVSTSLMPEIVAIFCAAPYRSFRGRSLAAWIDPMLVHPRSLQQEAASLGRGYYTSPVLLNQAPLRRLALNGYQLVVQPAQVPELLRQQKAWMLVLGGDFD